MTHKLLTVDKMWYYLDEYWHQIADKRVDDWTFISGGIWKVLAIMSAYLIITRVVLTWIMKNRPPLELRNVLLLYNILMVVINAVLFFCVLPTLNYGMIFLDFSFPSLEDRSPQAMSVLSMGWYFFISRYIDLADTVFFVLRKKNSQITFLHTYHHTIVPLIIWVSFKYNAMIPINRMFCTFNTFIHTLMYGYYALAAMGPNVTKFLWWKKYLTQLQILQFVICGTYGFILYVMQTDYPMDWFGFVVGQNPIFFYMFYDFYRQSYKKSHKCND